MAENKSKIYIGIILVIIIGITLWWVFKPKKISDEITNSNKENKEVVYTENINTSENTKFQEYQISEFDIIFSYPDNWQKNEMSVGNVTTPLTKQELASIYAPSQSSEENSISASGELLRFIIEKNVNINSKEDWHKYVKGKIDSLLDDEDLINETKYQFISLESVDDIDGHWTLREDYNHKDGIRGRDYYIFNEDIYQYVFECNNNIFSKYMKVFDNIAYSLKFK